MEWCDVMKPPPIPTKEMLSTAMYKKVQDVLHIADIQHSIETYNSE